MYMSMVYVHVHGLLKALEKHWKSNQIEKKKKRAWTFGVQSHSESRQ